jgi:hypothetical protein
MPASSSLAVIGLWLSACHSPRGAAPEAPPPVETAPAAAAAATNEPSAEATPLAQASPALPDAASAPLASPPLDCDARKAQIETTLKAASSCRSDGDCTTLMPGCPFGCTRAIQRSINVATIESEIADYKASCDECVYRCRPALHPPTCRAGFCSLD